MFEIDGVQYDIDTYLRETEELIDDMKKQQSRTSCNCATTDTVANTDLCSKPDGTQTEEI